MPVIEMVDVRYLNQSAQSQPIMSITMETAQEWVVEQRARWSRGHRYLRLVKISAEMYRLAPSLKPNLRTMDAVLEGRSWAIELVNSWASHRALPICQVCQMPQQ